MNAPTPISAAAIEAKYAARTEALEALNNFEFNYTTPFSGSGVDLAFQALNEAHSVGLALENLASEAEEGRDYLRSVHMGGAIGAINTLVALAAFAISAGQK